MTAILLLGAFLLGGVSAVGIVTYAIKNEPENPWYD